MRTSIACLLVVVLFNACTEKKASEPVVAQATAPAVETTQSVATTQTVATTSQAAPISENVEAGTWSGQMKVAQPMSVLNYVGAESGDWVPMRFRSDSDAGKKLLAACANDDMCEFTGAVAWLEEPPPPDASAYAEIVRVDSVKKLPPAQ